MIKGGIMCQIRRTGKKSGRGSTGGICQDGVLVDDTKSGLKAPECLKKGNEVQWP